MQEKIICQDEKKRKLKSTEAKEMNVLSIPVLDNMNALNFKELEN
jgi:hypothetical protein